MQDRCLNCDHPIDLSFCANCGQKNKENINRSIRTLLGELVTNFFFFDNRLWVSLRYLLGKPGLMTREFLDGKRKKFLSPISIFLFVNLLYFFASPITDYSLSLYDQMQRQVHSSIARSLVQERLAERGNSLSDYTEKYNKASLNLSKSIMLANVPLLALFIWPLFYRRSKYYYDALIFSLHYFTLFLLLLVMTNGLHRSLVGLGIPIKEGLMILIAVLILPFTMGVLSTRNFMRFRWWQALLSGAMVVLGLAFAQFFYRAIIFFLTFLLT